MTGYRIFAGYRIADGPTRPPIPRTPPRLVVVPAREPADPTARVAPVILEILADPMPGRPLGDAFEQKEAALRELFRSLDNDEARALLGRLSSARADDEVATRFRRMVPNRQQRLLELLDRVRSKAGAR